MMLMFMKCKCNCGSQTPGVLHNVSSIKLDSFYMLTKGANGVKAKFIGAMRTAYRSF